MPLIPDLKKDESVILTRATLLGRMKNPEDQASWQEFFDIYWSLIYNVARKAGLNDAEAQDAVQDTLISVAKNIPAFKYDPAKGSFKVWLLNLTRWRIVDQMRKRSPKASQPQPYPQLHTEDETGRTVSVERVPDDSLDWSAIWESDWEKAILEAALNRLKTRLDPKKFQIFDFYVNRDWPPEKVAQAFNVNISQVYLIKNRVTEMLREEFGRLEREAI